jgi:hypothetical protein
MNKLLTTTLIFLIVSFLNISFSQDEIDLDRKVDKILNYQNDIYRLPFDAQHIRTVVIPEIDSKKATIAPNFPDTRNIFNDELKDIIRIWIQNFPSEYVAYEKYLETFIRSNH